MSPAATTVPYLGPLELLLCLSSPLYIAQPVVVSEKAYNEWLQDQPSFLGEEHDQAESYV